MLWMADGDTGTVGAEHEATLRSTCRHSQQYRKVKPLVLFCFCGWGGQKNGIHLYILHQASWRPQCVSTAALSVPLSLQGQLCSHEAPANCKMEKPKGTKFRMSDALGKKNKLLLDSVESPLPPHAAEFSFCSVWVDFTSGPFPSMGCTNLLVLQPDFSWAPPGDRPFLFKASLLGSGGK